MRRARMLELGTTAFLAACGNGGAGAAPATTASGGGAQPTRPATTGGAAAAPTAPPAAPAAPAASVRLTVDGQPVTIQGDLTAIRQATAGVAVLTLQCSANARGRAGTGNGALVEMQSVQGKELNEGFVKEDVSSVTFTVWRDTQNSYTSTGSLPGQGPRGLTFTRTTGGVIAGSYEDQLSGGLGRLQARIEFTLPFPR